MKVDVSVRGDLGGVSAFAAAMEHQGWDGVWSTEVNSDPFLPLALAAASTRRVDLGTSIAVAFARNPMTVAQTAWDLHRLSGGRMILGLGSQVKAHVEHRFSMPWSQPVPRMREFILAVRAIWHTWESKEPLDFVGDFYRHTLMSPMFDAGRLDLSPPKIYLAAVGPKMAAVAGEVADGLLVHSFASPRYIEEVLEPAIAAGLARSGRSRSDFTTRYSPFVATGETPRELADSARTVRERIGFYGSTPAYRSVLEVHGWGGLQTELQALARDGQWKQMGDLISDDVLDAFAVVAPADEMASRFAHRVKSLTDRTTVVLDEVSSELAIGMRDAVRAASRP